jgi:hemerythrin superfamily protein
VRRGTTEAFSTGTPIAEGTDMDAPASDSLVLRDHLLADHRLVEQALEQLVAAFEADDRERMRELWTTFEAQLLAHLETEERFVMPGFLAKNARGARAIAEEHKHIRRRMTEIGTAVELHVVRLETLRAFIEELRAHARTEENLLYQWVDENMSEPEKTSILHELARMVEAKLKAARR